MSKVFVTLKLMNGDTVTIDEISGGVMMQAAFILGPTNVANGLMLAFEVSAIVVKKDGKSVGMQYMKDLMIDDITTIFESVNAQIVKVKM